MKLIVCFYLSLLKKRLLKDVDGKGVKSADYESVLDSLRKAGFKLDANWTNFINQHKNEKSEQISYEPLLQTLEDAVIENL